MHSKAPRARDITNQRVRRNDQIDEAQHAKNPSKSRVRARVKHVFALVKRLWGFSKVRYRGLAKNATRSFVVLRLVNIYLARGRLAKVRRKPAQSAPHGLKPPGSHLRSINFR
jgi:IS5 family transposase